MAFVITRQEEQQEQPDGIQDKESGFVITRAEEKQDLLGFVRDVPRAAARGVAGVVTGPGEAARMVKEELSPQGGTAALLKMFAPGGEAPQLPAPSEDSLLGKVDSFLRNILTLNADPEQARGFDIGNLLATPSTEKLKKTFEEGSGLSLSPETPPGSILGAGLEAFGQGLSFGPEAGLAFAKGRVVGQTLEELGAPELVSTTAEIATTVLNPKIKKPTKPSAKKPVVTEKQLKEFSDSIDTAEKVDLVFKQEPNFSKAAESIIEDTRKPVLDSLSPALDVEDSLNKVKEVQNEHFTRERAKASNFYDSVRGRVGSRVIDFSDSVEQLKKDRVKVEERFPKGSAGRQSVVSFMDDTISKLSGWITVDEAIILKQRWNEFFDFEFSDLNQRGKAINLTSTSRKVMKNELNKGLRRLDRQAFVDFRKAENQHAKNARTFGSDDVIKLQRSDSVLDVANILDKPQGVESLKKALPEGSSAKFIVDRSAIERAPVGRAASGEELALLDKKLTTQGQETLRELRDLSDQKNAAGRRAAIQNTIIEEIAEAHTTGAMPKKTLELMKTERGNKLVRDSVKRIKNSEGIQANLDNLFVKNIIDNVLKDGKIDLEKAKQLSKNKELLKAVKTSGPELAKLIEGLPGFVDKAERSLLRLSKQSLKKLTDQPARHGIGLAVMASVGIPVKAVLGAIALPKISKVLWRKILFSSSEAKRLSSALNMIKVSKPSSFIDATGRITKSLNKFKEEDSQSS